LDGIDLRDYKLADLRDQFAIVLQEPVLFSTTIAENIAYARPDASEDEIVQAAKRANAHEFIMRMPDEYQTRVGERGMRLSGGERQRISLARAFLKNTAILILDEPTSALDIKTETEIANAIQKLMRGRTVFVIAHRPSLLRTCDVLLIVQNGQPVAVTTAVTAATEALAAGESGIKLTEPFSLASEA
jgi:ATP-binding cassette subfamily B protein